MRRIERRENFSSPVVVHRPPIVGIDEVEIPEFRALIKIRNARGGHLDHELRQAVVNAQLRDTRLERQERQEELRAAAIDDRLHEPLDPFLVIVVRVQPTRVDLGLSHRLDHVTGDPLLHSCQALVVVRVERPGADERLIEEILLVRVRSERAVDVDSEASIQRPPFVTAAFHAPGISDSTLMRARISSPRFVSCVDVADNADGQSRRRSTNQS